MTTIGGNSATLAPDREFDARSIPADAIEGRWNAADGASLRRIDWRPLAAEARGSILFMPGRGDAYEKYLETLDYWHRRGWAVSAFDWRGQAGSGRLGTDPVTGHVDDFAIWVDDLAAIWCEWKAQTPGPHALIGHSMGGHLVLRALAEVKVNPVAAVLSAPMLGLSAKGVPLPLLDLAARTMCRVGDRRRPAWKWSERPGEVPAARGNLLTHDARRYADELWWREHRPELVMGPGSWGWTQAAIASMRLLDRPGVLERIATPVLVLATEHDKLVGYRAIVRAMRRLPHGELVRFGGEARHEILRETDFVRDRALAAIDAFLDRACGPRP